MISIRIATSVDSKALSELGSLTFYETWRPVNTEEDMQSYMKVAFDEKLLKTDLEDSKVNTFLLASVSNELAGYAKMRRDRNYPEFNNESAIEIERIYVKRKWQGHKIGKALMDDCLEIAQNENYKWIWLGVNIDNIKAIDFYKRYGFVIFGEKSFQLGNANDNDYLMKKMLQ